MDYDTYLGKDPKMYFRNNFSRKLRNIFLNEISVYFPKKIT